MQRMFVCTGIMLQWYNGTGVQDHAEGLAACVPVDLTATFERLACVVQRHNDCTKVKIPY